MRNLAAVGAALVLASCGFSPTESFRATVTYVGAELLYNHSVGSDWSTAARVNGVEVDPGDTLETDDTSVTLLGEASEWDAGASDVGESTVSVWKSELTASAAIFTVSVVVRENGGRYTGNTAEWEFTFSIVLSEDPTAG